MNKFKTDSLFLDPKNVVAVLPDQYKGYLIMFANGCMVHTMESAGKEILAAIKKSG